MNSLVFIVLLSTLILGSQGMPPELCVPDETPDASTSPQGECIYRDELFLPGKIIENHGYHYKIKCSASGQVVHCHKAIN